MPNWERIEQGIQGMLEVLQDELNWFSEEEMKNTAGRIARFYKEWWNNQNFKFTVFDPEKDMEITKFDELIIYKNINVYSMCSHHMLPFYGICHVAYLPSDKLCGASKIPRLVRAYASRPQTQERLTHQIADAMVEKLKPRFCFVVIRATHMCMACRGVKQAGDMVTSCVRYDKNDTSIDWKTLKHEALDLFKNIW